MRKILMVLTGGLPEAILAGCLLHGLRMRHPGARITALVPGGHVGAVQAHPAIHAVIAVPEAVELALAIPLWGEVGLRRLMESIRQEGFDLALAPSPARNALVDMAVLASEAADRIGWEVESGRGEDELDARGWDSFYTRLVDLKDVPYAEPDRYRHFVHSLGMDPGEELLSWPVCKRARRSAGEFLGPAQGGSQATTWLALWCGPRDATGYQSWREALRPVLKADPTMGLLLLGPGGRSTSTAGLAEWEGLRCLDLRGSLAADEQLEILSRCRAAIGAEGPWMSLCIARQIPHVALVGGGAFGRYAPTSPWTTAVCHPLACYFCGWACDQGGHHCLDRIPPQAVTEALKRALASAGKKPRLLISPVDPDRGIAPLDLESLLAPDACEQVRWRPVRP
ncbi:MAG TPA: hypothetical protein VN436_07840 [Holophaga sp.]|nr:hypothetical protein [Holophaga sp.]